MSDKWKQIWRECDILLRVDYENETGFYTTFLVSHSGSEYECVMNNGEVIKLVELGAA